MNGTLRSWIAALSAVPLLAAGGCDLPGARARPNVVLIMIDTLRADHLGCYGYERPTSPAIDDLARRGVRFDEAVSTAPFTKPATASLLTGLYPSAHGAISNTAHGLAENVPLLAPLLRDAGYYTAGFYRNGSLGPIWGFDRGFDVYELPDDEYAETLEGSAGDPDRPVATVDDRAVTFKVEPLLPTIEAPFFLYLHMIGPHDPYTPPRESNPFVEEPLSPVAERFYRLSRKREKGEKTPLSLLSTGRLPLDESLLHEMVALYDAEILASDRQVGRIVRALERNGLLESTVVIVVSDHGEEFLDHGGLGHGYTHYREMLRVPLVIAGPGVAQGVVEQAVSLVDVMPTVLELAGVKPPDEIDGRSFSRSLADPSIAPDPRPLYAEGLLRFYWRDPMLLRSVHSEGLKLVLDFQRHHKQLFDLERDATEEVNLLPGRSADGERLLAELIDIHDRNLSRHSRLAQVDVEVPEELAEELRSLGYLGSAKNDSVFDPFAHRLLIADLEPFGLMGDERAVSRYASSVDFVDGGHETEQLLYGWGNANDGPRWMRRRAGLVLRREPHHQSWRLRGRIRGEPGEPRTLELWVRVNGAAAVPLRVEGAGAFSVGGRLPNDGGSEVRLDLSCAPPGLSMTDAGWRDGYDRCVLVRSVDLL